MAVGEKAAKKPGFIWGAIVKCEHESTRGRTERDEEEEEEASVCYSESLLELINQQH